MCLEHVLHFFPLPRQVPTILNWKRENSLSSLSTLRLKNYSIQFNSIQFNSIRSPLSHSIRSEAKSTRPLSVGSKNQTNVKPNAAFKSRRSKLGIEKQWTKKKRRQSITKPKIPSSWDVLLEPSSLPFLSRRNPRSPPHFYCRYQSNDDSSYIILMASFSKPLLSPISLLVLAFLSSPCCRAFSPLLLFQNQKKPPKSSFPHVFQERKSKS